MIREGEASRYSPEEDSTRIVEAETEVVPESETRRVLGAAVESVKNKDAADPVIASGMVQDCKKWIKERKEKCATWMKEHPKTSSFLRGSLDVGIIGTGFYVKITKFGLLAFIAKFIQKKGKMTFAEGYDIGSDMLSFDKKKEKK